MNGAPENVASIDAEAVMAALHRDLAKLLEETSDGLALTVGGTIAFANSAFARQLGVAGVGDLVGTAAEDWVDPTDVVAWRAHVAGESETTPVRMVRRDGGIVHLELSPARPVSLADDARILMTHDVTERHRVEQRILDMAAQERRRIAYDLHDGLGQSLTAMSLHVKLVRDAVARGKVPRLDDLDEVANLVRETIEEARRMARGLDLFSMPGEGLTYALRQLAAGAETIFPVACRVTGDIVENIGGDQRSSQLYRIAQEAVNNAVRHGGASEVVIDVTLRDGELRLSVTDNGKGLKYPGDHKGMGLRIMRHRAELAGGRFSVEPAEGGGAVVWCVVPAAEAATQRA